MTRTRSDHGSAGRRVLIFFLVLIVVLVALDRISDAVAERLAADTIQSDQNLPKRPNVNITGFPFLTQFATGHFGKIIISDDDVPIGGSTDLRVSTIQVTLHHVHVARDLSSVHAEEADAVATMSFEDLGRALGGVHIRYDGGGRITASRSIDVLGRRFSGEISARPQFADGTLSFGAIQVPDANQLIVQAIEVLEKVFAVNLPLSGIPFGVRVKSLHADSAGLHLALVGRNLSYTR